MRSCPRLPEIAILDRIRHAATLFDLFELHQEGLRRPFFKTPALLFRDLFVMGRKERLPRSGSRYISQDTLAVSGIHVAHWRIDHDGRRLSRDIRHRQGKGPNQRPAVAQRPFASLTTERTRSATSSFSWTGTA